MVELQATRRFFRRDAQLSGTSVLTYPVSGVLASVRAFPCHDHRLAKVAAAVSHPSLSLFPDEASLPNDCRMIAHVDPRGLIRSTPSGDNECQNRSEYSSVTPVRTVSLSKGRRKTLLFEQSLDPMDDVDAHFM